MNATNPVKLHIERNERAFTHNGETLNIVDFNVIATFASGTNQVWGDPTNQRGAKSILTRHAKRFGMTKAKDGLSATA